MCIAQEVAGLRLTLDIVQLLAQHQVGLVEGHGLAELAPAGVAVPCTCVKTANQKPDNLDFISTVPASREPIKNRSATVDISTAQASKEPIRKQNNYEF